MRTRRKSQNVAAVHAAAVGGGPSGDAYLQEDGSSYFLLEDGSSFLLME